MPRRPPPRRLPISSAARGAKGDGIMAIFDGSQSSSENSKNSIKAAKLISKAIKDLNNQMKIDFAEEDLPEKVLKDAHRSIKEIHSEITKIIEDNKVGEKIRDGFRVSITGEVNAGKSSLLNLFSLSLHCSPNRFWYDIDDPIIAPKSKLNVEKYPFCLPNFPNLLSLVIISPVRIPESEVVFKDEKVALSIS